MLSQVRFKDRYFIRFWASLTLCIVACTAATLTNAQAPTNSTGVYIDPTTGLSWSRCHLGKTFSSKLSNDEVPTLEIECSGEAQSTDWFSAKNMARSATINGVTGWRVPTTKEWESLLKSNRKEAQLESIFPDFAHGFTAWSANSDRFTLRKLTVELNQITNDGAYAVSEKPARLEDEYRMIVVSGGKETPLDISNLSADRYFTDPQTGMVWVPSLTGPKYVRTYSTEKQDHISEAADPSCVENPNSFKRKCGDIESLNVSWWESLGIVDRLNLQGKSGWRLPTKAEVAAIVPKLSTAGYPRANEFLNKCRTMDAGPTPGSVLVRNSYSNSDISFKEQSADSLDAVCAVWSPADSPEFKNLVALSLTWNGESEFPINKAQAAVWKSPEQKAAESRALLAEAERKDKADKAAKIQQYKASEKAAYDARLLAIQKNTQPGMKAKQGTIIEVKGDQALLNEEQTYCVEQMPTWCKRYGYQVTGNQYWIKRSQLLPR